METSFFDHETFRTRAARTEHQYTVPIERVSQTIIDDQILPKSIELQRQAHEAVGAGKLEQAEDLLETALAVDPRNRSAFVDIARVAEKQHLFGKAIRMTNKALLLEPNDPDAIAVQGEAMVEMGASACNAARMASPWVSLPSLRMTMRGT